MLGVQTGGESSGLLAFFVLAIGTALTLLGLGLVQAATARALVEIDEGRSIGPLRAYRLTADGIAPLFGALLLAAVVVSLLASSLFLIPIAVWLAGRWALIVPAIELEGVSAIGALRRSGRLVRRRWLKVSSLIVAGGALAIIVGPLIGVVLILLTNTPFWLVNVVAGLIYAVTMPYVALTTAYVYFDARVRYELAGEQRPAELPAEIALG
jgi:MFS family permease